MNLEIILSILSFIGISGIIGAFFTYFWQKKKEISMKENELKEKRYLCILLLMYAFINPRELGNVRKLRPEIQNIDNLRNELQAEWVNSWIYAGDNTIKFLKEFIENPNENNFSLAILSMRKELWGKKTKLSQSIYSIKSFLR